MKRLFVIMLTALTLLGCESAKDTVYTVTFDSDGGTAVIAQKVVAGETATAPDNPTKQGYVFLFWTLNGANTAYNFQTPVNGDITLIAKWQEEAKVEYWQITWNLNGGSWAAGYTPPTQVVRGGTLSEPTAPVRAGSTFDGWYREAAFTNKVNFPYSVSGATADFTLFAKWETVAVAPQLELSWTFNSITSPVKNPFPLWDNGVGGSAWSAVVFTVTTNQTSWEAKSNQTWCEVRNTDKEGSFYLYLEPNTNDLSRVVTITVTAGNATPISFSIVQRGNADIFGTWRLTSNDGSWQQIFISADKVVLMNNDGTGFTISEPTFTAKANPGGDYVADYPSGFSITGKLTANSGYPVPRASGSGDASIGDIVSISIYMSVENTSIMLGNFSTVQQEARYGPYRFDPTAEYWQVTWNLDGGSWATGYAPPVLIAKDGMLAAPTDPTKTVNAFGGWYKEASLTNRITFPYDVSSVTGNITLYARWNPPATLRISVNPGRGSYTAITIQRQGTGGGFTNAHSVSTGFGTYDISVAPGTYRIFLTYWSCPTVNCMSTSTSGTFIVSSGQTRNITIVEAGVGL